MGCRCCGETRERETERERERERERELGGNAPAGRLGLEASASSSICMLENGEASTCSAGVYQSSRMRG
jgi:hypothetical protein